MKVTLHLLAAALAIACMLLTACGTPGAPQVPSLDIARPVEDLAATRKGDKVYLFWTPARETTDGQNIRRFGLARICRGVNYFPMAGCVQAVGGLTAAQVAPVKPGEPAKKVEFTDSLPQLLQEQNATGYATYAVESQNSRGRSAGLSNQVKVPLAPTLPPPTDVSATAIPDALKISWSSIAQVPEISGLSNFYRVYRRAEGTNTDSVVGEVGVYAKTETSILDRTFEWGKIYVYRVTVVTVVSPDGKTPANVEGDDSPPIRIFADDIFPPAVPVGVQAVASGVGQRPFIDLTWAPNTESDLAGYNVYRHGEGGRVTKINRDLVKISSFRDESVSAGMKYFYSVSAVDLRGNQSGKSEETSESLP